MVIPDPMKTDFLQAVHDHPTSGHSRRDKTLEKAQANGWWWTMHEDVIQYVKKCQGCKVIQVLHTNSRN